MRKRYTGISWRLVTSAGVSHECLHQISNIGRRWYGPGACIHTIRSSSIWIAWNIITGGAYWVAMSYVLIYAPTSPSPIYFIFLIPSMGLAAANWLSHDNLAYPTSMSTIWSRSPMCRSCISGVNCPCTVVKISSSNPKTTARSHHL